MQNPTKCSKVNNKQYSSDRIWTWEGSEGHDSGGQHNRGPQNVLQGPLLGGPNTGSYAPVLMLKTNQKTHSSSHNDNISETNVLWALCYKCFQNSKLG